MSTGDVFSRVAFGWYTPFKNEGKEALVQAKVQMMAHIREDIANWEAAVAASRAAPGFNAESPDHLWLEALLDRRRDALAELHREVLRLRLDPKRG